MIDNVDTLLRDPILVTGSPRSGKTLTAWILAKAEGVGYVCEPLAAWAIGARQRTDDARDADEATPEVIAQIRKACAAALVQAGGGRYVDDLAYHTLRIDFVRRVMPDVKIIHVIQDGHVAIPKMVRGWTYKEPIGRAVRRRWRGLSWKTFPRLVMRGVLNHWASKVEGKRRAWGPQPPGLQEFSREHADPVMIATMQWKGIVETALDDMARLPADRALTIRFEDLLWKTGETVERIAAFCGIADVESLQRGAAELLEPGAGAQGPTLSTEQWARIDEIIGPLRARIGYTSQTPGQPVGAPIEAGIDPLLRAV